jgi:rhodanese-related sulfurtransferase
MQSIDMIQLHEHSVKLGPKDVILDVRTPMEFADGHVPGARNIPVDQIESRSKELQGTEKLYIYCRAGRRADTAAAILNHQGLSTLGIRDVLVVDDGGFPDWEDQGFPVQK